MLLQDIFKKISPKVYKKGEKIYRAGDTPQGVYYLKSGLISLTMTSEKGNDLLLRLFKPDQFFGHRSFFANEKYHGTSIALDESEVYFMPTKDVRELIQSNPLCVERFLGLMASELRMAEMKFVSLSEKDVAQRIAESVVYLKETDPVHIWTRQQIAEFCGSTTPTVIRTLAKFEDLGLILQKGREIQILKRESLLNLGHQL